VWREVCALPAHPERLAEEYRRRWQPDARAQRMPLATLEAHLGKLRRGLARLLDSDAEGLIEKHEFEPRITRLRQRIAHVEAQGHEVAEEAALHTDLQLIIGRLEEFATRGYAGLEGADWTSKRELIRAMVKRGEGARDQVKVIFRVEPRPGDPNPEKKSLQDCRRSNAAALWRACGGGTALALFQNPRVEPGFDVATASRGRLRFGQEGRMTETVEALGAIHCQRVWRSRPQTEKEGVDRLPAGASWAKAVGMGRPRGFAFRLQGLADQRVPGPIALGGNAQGALFGAPPFGAPRASQRGGCAVETALGGQAPPVRWGPHRHPIDPRRVFAAIVLGDTTPRQGPSRPRRDQPLLWFVCCADRPTWRGLAKPRLEAEDLPVDLPPGEVWPGHQQGHPLCVGAWPLTHRFTLHATGPTSAYPGHDPWPWLLRAASSPLASGWHLRREGTSLTESAWGVPPFPGSLVASVGRCSPPGVRPCSPGRGFGCRRRLLCRFGSSVSASGAGVK
jgi:hypothetical protein